MTDTIGTRVKRIVSGGFHSMVDALEQRAPEVIMEQAIRELDEAIAEVRVEIGRTHAARHLATQRLMEENRRHE